MSDLLPLRVGEASNDTRLAAQRGWRGLANGAEVMLVKAAAAITPYALVEGVYSAGTLISVQEAASDTSSKVVGVVGTEYASGISAASDYFMLYTRKDSAYVNASGVSAIAQYDYVKVSSTGAGQVISAIGMPTTSAVSAFQRWMCVLSATSAALRIKFGEFP